jgi:hypothetical protein
MPHQVVKRWFDEIDGETPPIARETRALLSLNCIVTAEGGTTNGGSARHAPMRPREL